METLFQTRTSTIVAEAYPWSQCKESQRWSCFDQHSASPEVEVCQFLEAVVWLMKPAVVVETGTSTGSSAAAIARGLQANRHGHLYSYELSRDKIEIATSFLHLEGILEEWVTFRQEDTMKVEWHNGKIDLFFSDGADDRYAEMRHFEPNFHERTVIVVHDADNPAHDWKRCDYNQVKFSTPVGLYLLQQRR